MNTVQLRPPTAAKKHTLKELCDKAAGTAFFVTSLEEAGAELDREILIRKKCFVRWVEEERMSEVDGRDRLGRLMTACAFLTLIHRAAGLATDDQVKGYIEAMVPTEHRAALEAVTDSIGNAAVAQ